MANKNSGKNSFVFFYHWLDTFKLLEGDEVLAVLESVIEYDKALKQNPDAPMPTFKDRALNMAFANFSPMLRLNAEKYKEQCDRANKLNKNKNTEVGTTSDEVGSDNDIDNDIDYDYDSVPDNDSDSVNDSDNVSVLCGGSGSDIDSFDLETTTLLAKIKDAWNSSELTSDIEIEDFSVMTDYLKNTNWCIKRVKGFENFIEVIRSIDSQGYFNNCPAYVDYGWFIKPETFLKVIGGYYESDFIEDEYRRTHTRDSWIESLKNDPFFSSFNNKEADTEVVSEMPYEEADDDSLTDKLKA